MADGIKVSQLTQALDPTGGYIEVSIPDGSGGWFSRRFAFADLFGDVT